MSEAHPNETFPSPPPKKNNIWPLRVALIIILLLMVAALAWDRRAGQISKAKHDEIIDWVEKPSGTKTNEDVRKLIGHDPDNGLEDKEYYFSETYSWPRGLPGRTYFVTVLYRKENGKAILHEAVMNVEPERTDIPNRPSDIPVDPPAEKTPPEEPPTTEKPAAPPANDAPEIEGPAGDEAESSGEKTEEE